MTLISFLRPQRSMSSMLSWFSNGSLKTSCLCEFHASSITFLGFVVQQGQLSLATMKVRAVTEWFLDFVKHYGCGIHTDRKVLLAARCPPSHLFLAQMRQKQHSLSLFTSDPILGFGTSDIRISASPRNLSSQKRSSIPEPSSAGNWLWPR